MSASQRSSSTTIGIVRPEPARDRDLAAGHLEAAVADEADDRHDPAAPASPRSPPAARSPSTDQPLVMRKLRGACARPLARDLVGVRADIEGQYAVPRQHRAHDVDRLVRAEFAGARAQRGLKRVAVRGDRTRESQRFITGGPSASAASAASRSPTTSCAICTEPSVSARSISIWRSGDAPIQASYSTSMVS